MREVWESDLTSFIYMQLPSFPNTTCWRNYLSSLRVLPPLSKADHRCVGLFLGSLLSMYIFVLVPYHFNYWSFVLLSWANSRRWWGTGRPGMLQSMRLQRAGHNLAMNNYCLKSRRVMLPALFFSLKIALAILSLSWFHISFRILCSVNNLTGIILNL